MQVQHVNNIIGTCKIKETEKDESVFRTMVKTLLLQLLNLIMLFQYKKIP